MSNIKNLNEEISRIKSLFGEERLYGNLIGESLNGKRRKRINNGTSKTNCEVLGWVYSIPLKKSGKKSDKE